MKKTILTLVFGLVSMTLLAGPVDLTAARNAAQSFLNNSSSSARFRMNPSGADLTLLHSEMSTSNAQQPVYYIFTTSDSYVIVSGDDRAVDILAYGDFCLDMNNIPLGMKDMLNQYRDAIEFLLENPTLKVNPVVGPSNTPSIKAASVGPLLTCNWDQEAPFNRQCNINGHQCLSGCCATSAAMVLYYWKYPTKPTPVIPGYNCRLSYSILSKIFHMDVYLDPLPSTTFDWDNMLDSYSGDYTDEQANAVATLMRYVGQAEHMEYGTTLVGGSELQSDSLSLIADAFVLFGYDPATIQVVKKTSAHNGGATLYTDAEWAEIIQTEILAGRPIVFTADYDNNDHGHAFNIDGYDSSTDKYHINFGWSGYGNGWFALNAISYLSFNYNIYQQAVIGIQPPVDGDPVIHADCNSVNFGAGYNGYEVRRSFTVTAENLRQNITVSLGGANASDFYIDGNSTITPAQAAQGAEVTIAFSPIHEGLLTATVTLSSPNAADVVIPVTGFGIKTGAIIEASDSALSFETTIGNPVSMQLSAVKRDFDGWLASGLEDDSPIQVFSVNASIEGDECFKVTSATKYTTTQGNDSIIFTVQYDPLSVGEHQAQLILRSATLNHLAHPVTVMLTGTARRLGDVNGDGLLTIEDFFILKDAVIANDEEILVNPNADVNSDGVVDIKDFVQLVDMLREIMEV